MARSMQDIRQESSSEYWSDPVIEAYKRDVDRTLLREALKMTPEERIRRLQQVCELAEEFRRAGQKARAKR